MVLDLARTLKDAARLGGRGLLAFKPFRMAHSLDTSYEPRLVDLPHRLSVLCLMRNRKILGRHGAGEAAFINP